nr:MAG TPA: ProQ C-terminal domain [Caudoviricetes sp.]
MSNLKIGDKVKFVLGTSLLTGTITKFYKNPYNRRDECSVKTEVKTYSHILLHRVSKIEDNQILEEKNTQIADLQHRLEVAEKALELACNYLVSVEGDELYKLCKDIYNDNDYLIVKMNYFKEQAEEEVKGE